MSEAPTVSFSTCASYGEVLPAALHRVLAPLGGMQAFVSRGQSVLIKPNMLTDRTPDRAVTTHPQLVRAVIRAVRDCGGVPAVGDSPASAVKIDRVREKTGIAAVCEEEGVALLNFESAGSEIRELPGFKFQVARPVTETDVLINLPKVKTHVLTTLTAAVKNIYGVLPGFQKAHLHKACPDARGFGRLLNALHSCVPPAINIADAVLGMEGDGPSGGDPVELGFLAASTDAHALDRALCRVLNIPAESVPYLREECGAPSAVEPRWHGPPPEALSPATFRVPGTLTARLIPAWLIRSLDRYLWIRPEITDSCVFCGRCAEACPVSALAPRRRQSPELLPDRCIGCCCCHEVCPEKAIRMALSPLLSLIRRGRSVS